MQRFIGRSRKELTSMILKLVFAIVILLYTLSFVRRSDGSNTKYEEVSNEIINLQVFFESRCPDSQNFINKQLAKSVDNFKDILKVVLIPFGKASVIILKNIKSNNSVFIFEF